ncbi:hypothetical protein CDAR_114061 [Caerostris darwini]|uniref:Uncharacterized protein n=1 Tax=Caerostris darwini TaxID=1538125 RepID=A0AAV4RZI8_9ARAC|nr:hypothetical protein CDAR_114061 [Caerostris darwini]
MVGKDRLPTGRFRDRRHFLCTRSITVKILFGTFSVGIVSSNKVSGVWSFPRSTKKVCLPEYFLSWLTNLLLPSRKK